LILQCKKYKNLSQTKKPVIFSVKRASKKDDYFAKKASKNPIPNYTFVTKFNYILRPHDVEGEAKSTAKTKAHILKLEMNTAALHL
jgi:hypothetical protein